MQLITIMENDLSTIYNQINALPYPFNVAMFIVFGGIGLAIILGIAYSVLNR